VEELRAMSCAVKGCELWRVGVPRGKKGFRSNIVVGR
jgi:hypothetical protein